MTREIHIIRHAERLYGTENLTLQGIEQAQRVHGKYYVSIASPVLTQETVALITGKFPVIDAGAGFDPSLTDEQIQRIDRLAIPSLWFGWCYL